MHLDTHVLVWLYQGLLADLAEPARTLLESEPLLVSPMAILELDLLHEIGRTTESGATVLAALGDAVGLTVSATPFPEVVRAAAGLAWTRDPFDRLICAQAVADRDILLTRDRRIRRHLDVARWD